MTSRERRRQRLMWAVEHWMRRHGLCAVLLFSFFLTSAAFAEEEAKKPAKPVSLMKILSDKDLTAAIAPKAAKKETKSALPKQAAPAPAVDEKTAQMPKDKDEKVVEKTVTGTVGFIRRNKMSVEFASSDEGGEEILLGLDDKIKVSGIKDFSAIKYGDQVQVKYAETFKEPKDKGQKTIVLSRVGTGIKFLKEAPKEQTVAPDAMLSREGS